MTLATRLRLVFALVVGVLGGVLVFHVAAIRRSVESGRTLAAISARQQLAAVQLDRTAELSANARKFLVTRDRGYLERLLVVTNEFGQDLDVARAGTASDVERSALVSLTARWQPLSDSVARAARDEGPPAAAMPTVRRMDESIGAVRSATQRLAEASRHAMTAELARGETWSRMVERVSWTVAMLALLMGIVLSTVMARSIVHPLERLAEATREVARGRLGFRIDVSGSDELARVSADFNHMSARLAELDRMKRDFVSNVSHDLKTPLSSIQEATDVLLEGLAGPLTERQRHLLALNQESGRRLSSMIAKLLDLARLEARTAPPRELLDLTAMVERAVDHVNLGRSMRGLPPGVTFRCESGRLLLRADAEGVAQVLDNLLENATRFSPELASVTVHLAERDGLAILRVADQGPGIANDEKDRVFERFYQTEAGRAVRARGAGLGLAICRHIVHAHGGTIQVSDNAPRGSVFRVQLPGAISVPLAEIEQPPFAASLG